MTIQYSVPDICDNFSDSIQVGDIHFQSYGKKKSFYGQVETLFCPDDNSLVKKLLNTNSSLELDDPVNKTISNREIDLKLKINKISRIVKDIKKI